MIKQQLESDLKAALLAGEKQKAMALRGLKSAVLYEEVALGKKESGLSDEEIAKVFGRELKKRQEAAELFRQGGNNEKADSELAEAKLIQAYLPEQISEEQLREAVKAEVAKLPSREPKMIGQVIGAIRGRFPGQVDGAAAARIAKEELEK